MRFEVKYDDRLDVWYIWDTKLLCVRSTVFYTKEYAMLVCSDMNKANQE